MKKKTVCMGKVIAYPTNCLTIISKLSHDHDLPIHSVTNDVFEEIYAAMISNSE